MQRIRLFVSHLGLLLLCGLCWQCSNQPSTNQLNEAEESASEEVVYNPYLEEILQEIEGGDTQNIDKKDGRGNAPIHLAVKLPNANQRRRALNLLLKGEADVNAEDAKENTALHLVLGQDIDFDLNAEPDQNPIKDLVHMLLDAGAEVNKVNENGNAPIHLAVKKSQTQKRSPFLFDKQAADKHRRVIELLLSYDADINLKNRKGRTALMLVLKRCSDEAYFEFFKEMAASSKIDWKQKDEEGKSLLHFAADIPHDETRKKCIDHLLDRIKASVPANSMTEKEFKSVFMETKCGFFPTIPKDDDEGNRFFMLICGVTPPGYTGHVPESLAEHLTGDIAQPR